MGTIDTVGFVWYCKIYSLSTGTPVMRYGVCRFGYSVEKSHLQYTHVKPQLPP